MRDPIQDVLFRPETREEIEENAVMRMAVDFDLVFRRLCAERDGAMEIQKVYAEALEEALRKHK